MTEALQRLIDKDEIRDVMARYCRGVDRADWDLVRSTYHTDAYDDHGDYRGNDPRPALAAFLRRFIRPTTWHFRLADQPFLMLDSASVRAPCTRSRCNRANASVLSSNATTPPSPVPSYEERRSMP